MTINFDRVKAYLDGIANQPGVDLGSSPHGAFWQVTLDKFKTGTVPHVSCPVTVGGAVEKRPIPIVKPRDSANSPFYQILLKQLQLAMPDGSTCKKDQMPAGGPFITDQNSSISITLTDGSTVTVTGAQIEADLKDWIDAGCPA